MKLEQSFEVAAPIEQVWTALIDLEQVAPCLPGASITGHDEDGTYHGEFQVKLGPTTASYRGTIKIESADADTHTATLAARGRQARPGRRERDDRQHAARDRRRRDAGRRRDRLHDHRPARLVRARRDDQGHLQPAPARLRGCLQQRLAAEPAGAMTGEEAAASAGAARRRGQVAGRGERGRRRPPSRRRRSRPRRRRSRRRPAAAPVKGFSLLFGVLWERIRNVFGRR